MKAPFEAVASAINSHPRTVLIALAGAILLALVGTSMVSMATGTDTYLDKDTPRGMLLAKYSETFQSDAMLVLIEADDVLNPAVLAYIDRLQSEIRTEAHVASAASVADMVRQMNGGDAPDLHGRDRRGAGAGAEGGARALPAVADHDHLGHHARPRALGGGPVLAPRLGQGAGPALEPAPRRDRDRDGQRGVQPGDGRGDGQLHGHADRGRPAADGDRGRPPLRPRPAPVPLGRDRRGRPDPDLRDRRVDGAADQHGHDRRVPRADRDRDRLRDPVPFALRRGGPADHAPRGRPPHRDPLGPVDPLRHARDLDRLHRPLGLAPADDPLVRRGLHDRRDGLLPRGPGLGPGRRPAHELPAEGDRPWHDPEREREADRRGDLQQPARPARLEGRAPPGPGPGPGRPGRARRVLARRRDPDLDRRGHLRAEGHAGPDQPREGEPDHGLDRVHADLRPGRPRPLPRGDPLDARVPGEYQVSHNSNMLGANSIATAIVAGERRRRAHDAERGRRGPRR